jgi:hypothetical protein
MRRRSALAVLAAVLALGPGAPAFAADPTPAPTGDPLLTSKIDAAIANATSYRIAVAGPAGLTLDIREFGPDRVKIVSMGSANPSESIVVGTSMYYRAGGGDWKAYPVPPVPRMRRNRLYMGAPDTLLEPLADRAEGPETVGAFRSVAAGNGLLPGTMDCTYDKVTYRPRACSVLLRGMGSPLKVSYAGWDDPANAVEPPPGIAAPAPLPSASAGPKPAPN